MLELLEQVLGISFVIGLIAGYFFVITQKPDMDKLYEQYLNRKK